MKVLGVIAPSTITNPIIRDFLFEVSNATENIHAHQGHGQVRVQQLTCCGWSIIGGRSGRSHCREVRGGGG